jgi:hypothetical protein
MNISRNHCKATFADSLFNSIFQLARTPNAARLISPIMAIAAFQQFSQSNPVNASALLFSLIVFYTPEVSKMASKVEGKNKRKRGKLITTFSLVVGILAIAASLVGFLDPAQAQFFQAVQTWMGTAIPGISAEMLALIFNVLRGVFVLYLGIGIVKVIQAAREGEDWQTLARTPLIIVVAVTMGDALAKLITG